MFQSDDDITFDAEFLSGTFDLASTTTSAECSKRHSEQSEPQSGKKPSQNTLDILSLLKSKAEKPVENRFARPVPPCKKRRVVQRKFPGPAGILPAQRDANVELNKLETESEDRNDCDEMVCSQQSDDVFTRPAWRRMLQDLGSVPGDRPPGLALPERYTIAWAKARAARRQLDGGRTPFLAAVVQQIDCTTRNPMAVLKDQTGEIQATLIHELWEEYGEQLHTGAVILLRQVGVLSTAKQHYLAITLNNLFAIYSDEASDTSRASNSPAVTKVNYMTSSDFIKTLADLRNPEDSRENDYNKVGLHCDAPRTLNDSCESRRDTNVRNDAENNRLGLFSNAECSKNSAARSNTRKMNSLELFSTAEPSFKHSRSDCLTRSNTHRGPTNSLGLFSTAEPSFKHPPNDSQTRRDTLPRSNTHSRPGLFSSAQHTSNMAKFTTASHADSIISETPTFLRPDFDKSTEKSSKLSQESEMLSQILDGLDAESIFDDF